MAQAFINAASCSIILMSREDIMLYFWKRILMSIALAFSHASWWHDGNAIAWNIFDIFEPLSTIRLWARPRRLCHFPQEELQEWYYFNDFSDKMEWCIENALLCLKSTGRLVVGIHVKYYHESLWRIISCHDFSHKSWNQRRDMRGHASYRESNQAGELQVEIWGQIYALI